MTPHQVPAVQAVGIDKHFGSTHALRGVDLSLDAGRCLGLVGRNGAGKSTMVSVLSGLLAPDAGQVLFDGEPAPPAGAVDAWHGRIATVFQHSMVVPQLTVAENVFLGNWRTARGGRVNWRTMRERTDAIMGEWGFDISATTLCEKLTVEQLQIVEIARALATGARCLLLDEPTAALERGAVQRLFDRVNQLVAGGVAVMYISHHLEEVFEICQDVVVLRDGEVVATAPTAELTKEQLVAVMVGGASTREQPSAGTAAAMSAKEPEQPESQGQPESQQQPEQRERSAAGGAPVLVVEGLASASPRGRLNGVSLEIAAGECVGVTGLLSAGVSTLGRVVAGAESCHGGRVLVKGQTVRLGRRDLALKAGIGYIPEDRRAEGFVAHLGVAENATMSIGDRLAGALGLLRPVQRAEAARPLVEALSVVASGPDQPVGELSGGNQQKVTVARTLLHDPAVIVAITPTRGVDVASKALLLGSLTRFAKETGAALLLASDELDDLVLCDRVVVLVRGEVFAEFTEPPFDREQLIAATEGISAGAGIGEGIGRGNGVSHGSTGTVRTTA
ncbi:sugar ABC transporter ATP-binding protein [Streptacidiphilus albus]|uniref:sugar ABC transporter ATP-binding protein n=1 Tax=Streptacidiphilus albus TaxID=105425 RepID=UPI0005AA81D4|nr:sugar ABC transporter ATP-binding protein [Streptacidiphilus albus]